MLVQKGKIFLGHRNRYLNKYLNIFNNSKNWYIKQVEVPTHIPVNVDSYDLVSKTFLSGTTIVNSLNTLPLKVNSVSLVHGSGIFLITLNGDIQSDDIIICREQSNYSVTNYCIMIECITKLDRPSFTTMTTSQVRLELRAVNNSGTVYQDTSHPNNTAKYCLMIYRKKTEVI